MTEARRPAEPAGDDKEENTGYAAVARRLNELDPKRRRPISRQLVYKWYMYRAHNGFPEAVGMRGSGTGRPIFDMKAVEIWYAKHRSTHGDPTFGQQTSTQAPAETLQKNGEDFLAA